ncbi:hypothetical protein VCRLGP8_990022 [Vibrio crassostreae]|nr:hypothetical protein VCRLGP8_990022 [Vibrio crassostreae]
MMILYITICIGDMSNNLSPSNITNNQYIDFVFWKKIKVIVFLKHNLMI